MEGHHACARYENQCNYLRMNVDYQQDRIAAWRLLQATGLLILLALGVGLLGGPWVFNGLLWLGRVTPGLHPLRTIEFEEVVSRLVLITLVLGLIPIMRRIGHFSWSYVGWTLIPDRGRMVFQGWVTGVLSVAALYALGMAVGGYTWSAPGWGVILGRLIAFGCAGILIAFIEELFFRGILYGCARRVMPPALAALLVGLFFASVHFMRPINPDGVVYGHWYSGLELLPHLFHRGDSLWYYFPFGLTLFLMSLALCVRMERDGHVYHIIGLHAGWVLMLGTGKYFLDRHKEIWPVALSPSENVARSPAALALMFLFFVVYLVRYRAKR
jgi:uncharacterized protein